MKILNNSLEKKRLDCFIIWPHGIEYVLDICEEIEREPFLKIVAIKKKNITNIKNFVDSVYSFDYAPLLHLKSKIAYLKKTGNVIFFIFVVNNSPQIDYFGTIPFRHVESKRIKDIKNTIRAKYNPKYNGVLSDEHVIHCSDDECQSMQLLKLAGFKESLYYRMLHDELPFPWFIGPPTEYRFIHVDVDHLVCGQIDSPYTTKFVPVKESVQYAYLQGDRDKYSNYISNSIGKELQVYYSEKKFNNLISAFSYSSYIKSNLIIVKKINEVYLILDGLHRASLLVFGGRGKFPVVVINE